MALTVIRNCNIYNGESPELLWEHNVLIENERIKEVSETPIKVSNAVEIDARGRTLMPGLSDAHVHLLAPSLTAAFENLPYTLRMAHAVPFLKGMLDRGFTTVRDAAGADWGVAAAVDQGLVPGPRVFVSGKAISQTGGHGDFRGRSEAVCGCYNHLVARLADGVPEVRKAVRDELRKGARQIKVMLSGGLASVNSGMSDYTQFSREELFAVVEEAKAKNTYVLAHAYTPNAIEHAVTAGVRSIEHAIFIDKERAELVSANGAYVVPTLACYGVKPKTGALLEQFKPRLQSLLDAMAPCIQTCDQAGVKLGFGTDLTGDELMYQTLEFQIRGEVQSPEMVIRSATSINAEIFQMKNELGVIKPGALADLLVVNGNPLENLQLLQEEGANLDVIMKNGELHKNNLDAR